MNMNKDKKGKDSTTITTLYIVLLIIVCFALSVLSTQHDQWVKENCKAITASYPIEKMLTEQSGNFLNYSTNYYIIIAGRSFGVTREQFAKWHEGDQVTATKTSCPYLDLGPIDFIEPNF